MKTAILGRFDGFHIGHQALMTRAKKEGNPILAWTFEPREGDIFSAPVKKKLLFDYGADEVILSSFDEVKDMSPEEFVIMLKRLGVSYAVCGFNFRFGKNRQGSPDTLKELFDGNIAVVDEVKTNIGNKEQTVSSTLLRSLLAEGRMEEAVRVMGHPYLLCGEVKRGKQLGRQLGFPTANQLIDGMLIKKGVYGGKTLLDGKTYKTVTNIGVIPTLGGENPHAETYIIDYQGDLYGKQLNVEITSFLRPEMKAQSLDALKKMIMSDVNEIIKHH